jgi:molybdate transport system substrate-binding protein
MTPRRPLALRVGAVLLGAVLLACQPSPASVELTVYGAASLTDALAVVETAYEAANPGINLLVATDSSATLRTQIEEGAPVDVFLSADTDHPAALVGAGLAPSIVTYARNTLALVVPLANPAQIGTAVDIARPGVQMIAAGPEVPVTAYARRVVSNLAALPRYPPNFVNAYVANVVSEEENVRALLARIELNEGDGGFVYRTDALASDLVTAVPIPAEANVTAAYGACVLAGSGHTSQARAFLDWLAGPEGFDILADFGFVVAP